MDEEFSTAVRDRLGSTPADVPLDARVVERTQADGFERRLVEYAVEPDERVTAYLLVPDETPAPGILAVHQHAGQYALGKSEPAGLSTDGEFHYGAALARRGYVVLCPDLLAFEDRRPPEYERESGTALDGRDYERFVATDAIARGSCLQAKYLSDLSVGLDYLESHDAAGDSLGVIGHSLGGQEAVWLAWYDDKIDAAMSSCGVSPLRAIQRDGILHNFAMYVPGVLEIGDVDDVVADVAPTPLFVSNGSEDPIFPVDSVREMNATVSETYAEAGVPERYESEVFDGGHGFPPDVRERAYEWFDRWLSG